MTRKRKLALVISINDKYYYPIRTFYTTNVFHEYGYDVTVLSSDFDHQNKEKYKDERKGLIQLPTIPYSKNLSIRRMLSLIDLSYKAVQYAEKLHPDLIYVSGPPNMQYKVFAAYKKKYPEVRVLAEVGDVWPESLPIQGKMKKVLSLPIKMWKTLRNHYIGSFDFVITECNLFAKILSPYVEKEKLQTLYFCKPDLKIEEKDSFPSSEVVTLGYVGSINNIIDIDLICKMVSAINEYKKVVFHLIGVGEKQKELCNGLDDLGIELHTHGAVYDAREKEKILKECHFAFNVMKSTVCVGMTMKSLDYFQHGIPILNNIEGDTWEMVADEQIGFNFKEGNLEEVAQKIAMQTEKQWKQMRMNTRKVFSENFSQQVFEKQFASILDKVIGKSEDEKDINI